MTEIISIKDMPTDFKIKLVEGLGYSSDGKFVLDENGDKLLDRYTEELICLDNMAILPGSTIILDDNPLSISSYLDEFGDV
ncbi:hypothetical protein MUP77_24390 [Candidatus Bathyarchaeota archaeon]|nr:hypothetical protein [Candidatus Bathyarchaeota archaeon]